MIKIYSLHLKYTKEPSLHWFQFQLLHRILLTNNYLHKIGLFKSPLCYLCQQTTETIEHIFAECFAVKEIWIEVERWILEVFKQFLITSLYFLGNMKKVLFKD